MKSLTLLMCLSITGLANANVVKTFEGLNSIDQSPCIIKEIKSDDGITYTISAKASQLSIVYNEENVSVDQMQLGLKTDSAKTKWAAGIAKSEQSKLTLNNDGFSYKFKGKYTNGYSGDSKITSEANLDISQGTFNYSSEEKMFMNVGNGLYEEIKNHISIPAIFNDRISCTNIVENK